MYTTEHWAIIRVVVVPDHSGSSLKIPEKVVGVVRVMMLWFHRVWPLAVVEAASEPVVLLRQTTAPVLGWQDSVISGSFEKTEWSQTKLLELTQKDKKETYYYIKKPL